MKSNETCERVRFCASKIGFNRPSSSILLTFQGGSSMFSCFEVSYAVFDLSITKTRLYNFDPLKPHFYIVKLGFTGVYIIFLIFAQKHILWVLVRTASPRRF